jgi:cytochrome c553
MRMRHPRLLGIAGLAVLALAAAAFAQSTVTPLPEQAPAQAQPLGDPVTDLAKTHWGDAEAGQAKAGACAACHGVDGNPSDAQYPRIAGMPERYVAQQLALFKAGVRTSGMAAVMAPMAAPLSAQDMRDVGAYFARQKAGAGVADDSAIASGPYAGMKFYEVGQKLFRGGDPVRGIPACMACHGPAGAGNPGPAFPHIGGQQSAYVVRRLQEYRTGTTTEQDHHLFDMMATVAKNLSDEEIPSLGSYLQGLHPRSDEAGSDQVAMATAAAPPAPAAAPASSAAPASAATPASVAAPAATEPPKAD